MIIKIFSVVGILFMLTGCITTESCSRINLGGVKLEIGCDEVVMQPITNSTLRGIEK